MAELCRYKVSYTDPIKKMNFFTYLDAPENDEKAVVTKLCATCSGVQPDWVTDIELMKHYGREAPES